MNEYLNKKRSSGDYGRQETLPPSLQSKMSQSFGMDFSNVKVYRNEEMAGTGMKGLASGNRVILSKEINLNTLDGQAVLGHELSHIHAQSQGIGMGNSGLYRNASLERQADSEGLMAAHGQPIFGGSAGLHNFGGLTPLSGGLSASAGAPMQALGGKDDDGRGKASLGERLGFRSSYLGKGGPVAGPGVHVVHLQEPFTFEKTKKNFKNWRRLQRLESGDTVRRIAGKADVDRTLGYSGIKKFFAGLFNLGNSKKNITERGEQEAIRATLDAIMIKNQMDDQILI